MARQTLAGLAISAVSLVATLVGIEAALRLGSGNAGRGPAQAPAADAAMRPRSPIGQPDFRLPGYELGPKSEAFRILVVGDSFAWGDGVEAEDAFPHLLDVGLNSLPGETRFEVVNWSRPGWNTARQMRTLHRRLRWLEPDLLILSFVLNDPEPISPTQLRRLRREVRERQPRPGVSAILFRHSRLYEVVWTRLENTRQRRALTAYYHSLYEGELWQRCWAALRQMRNAARRHAFPMLLVVFPVFDSELDDSYPYRGLHAKMRETGEALQVPVLDLLPAYRRIDVRRLAVVPFTNAHPNALGHRLAADAIMDRLVRCEHIPLVGAP